MIVKCINNNNNEESLTLNRIYKVIKNTNNFYSIIDDKLQEHCYSKERFEVLKPREIETKEIDMIKRNSTYGIIGETSEIKELIKEVKFLRKEVNNNKMKYTETYFKIKLWLFALQIIISIPLISFIIKYLQILLNK